VSGCSNPLVGGGGALVYPSIHSPGFIHSIAGWTINKNGSAEFNNVVIRGGVVISGTELYYSGTPAAGNLIASVATANDTDTPGNAYLKGIVSYFNTGSGYVAEQLFGGETAYWTAPTEAGPWTLQATIFYSTAQGFNFAIGGTVQFFLGAFQILTTVPLVAQSGLEVTDADTGLDAWVPTVTTLAADDPTTLVAATQILGQAVVSGHSYLLEAEVYFSVAVNADHLVLGFGGLTANTSFLSVAGMLSGFNNNPAQVNQIVLPGSHVTGAAPNINATGYARLSCTFTMSAASTVSLSFSAGTAGQSVSVLKGTTLRLTRTF
jgi:hypothetical protein